jgi:hypothetical protein
MRSFLAIAVLALLAASCTPPELRYCQSVNAPVSQLDQCTSYYFQQEAAFQSDLQFCSAEADQTYPPTLYSGWGTALVHNHYRGGFGSVEQIEVPPDYQRNAQLDALRFRIIDPCMQSRGWNSGASWQAGRHQPGTGAKSKTLPWSVR